MAGATTGMLPCRGISASVTKIGRDGIDLTAQVVTRPYAPIPTSPVEFEFQYHERVETVGWPFDEKKTPADVLKAVRMDYFKNRRPESPEQFEKRRADSLASYPIPRLPDETTEEHSQRILEAIDFIYGDSVTADTPVLVRLGDGRPVYRTVDEINGGAWVPRPDGKEVAEPLRGLCVWSDKGWTRVKLVIRHATRKRILRVLTHSGCVDVTEDHSLLAPNGQEVKPSEVRVGDRLLHSDLPDCEFASYGCPFTPDFAYALGLFYADGSCGEYECDKASWAINEADRSVFPRAIKGLQEGEPLAREWKILDTIESSGVYKLVPSGSVKQLVQRWRDMFYDSRRTKKVPDEVLWAPKAIREAFLEGYYRGDNTTTGRGKLGSAGLYLLTASLGYKVGINTRVKDPDAVKKVHELHLPGALLVYDLETEDHHFAAGVGRMVVHNTDSIMVLQKQCKNAAEAIAMGQAFSRWITRWFFHRPMAIAFEKIYYPFVLFAKKRYAGVLWTTPNKPDKKDTKGLESMRRDNAPVTAKMVDNLIDCLFYEKSFEKAVRLVMRVVQSIMDGSIDVSLLIISKSLSKEAKDYTATAPHVTLTRKLQKRDLHTAPRMGDRVPYVVVARGDSSIKAHEKAEDPLWTIQHDLQIDRQYYLMNQLMKPVERILEPLLPGITSRLFSAAPCTIYIPSSVAAKARKLTKARTGTGASESQFALVVGSSSSSPAAATPKPAAKKKPVARGDLTARLVPGQTSLLMNEMSGKPTILKPLGDAPQLKSWAKAPPKKPKAHVSGQTEVFKTAAYVKPPERDITRPEEGYAAVDIRYKVAAGTPVVSKDSIAKFGRIMPKCLACRASITPDMLSESDLTQDAVAPVCSLCRTQWRESGKSVSAEFARLKESYLREAAEADARCKALWSICMTCQNVKSVEDVPICGAKDCKNFYPRTAAKVRRGRLDNTLGRLQSYELREED